LGLIIVTDHRAYFCCQSGDILNCFLKYLKYFG